MSNTCWLVVCAIITLLAVADGVVNERQHLPYAESARVCR